MISWMCEDILPKVKKGSKPEDVLLKFANEQNFTPAILEGMGHLYNTAKTLSFLEKSANRGATFPIIDVPELVDKYIEVRPTKKATAPQSEDTLDNLFDLPELFAEINREGTIDEPAPVKMAMENPLIRANHKRDLSRIEIDYVKQAKFDLQMDAQKSVDTIERKLRESFGDYSFHQMEQDAIYAIGPEVKSAMDKIATALVSAHVPVKRASDGGVRRLVKDPYHMLDQVEHVVDCLCKLAAADEMLKEAGAMQAAREADQIDTLVAPEHEHAGGRSEGHAGKSHKGPSKMQFPGSGQAPSGNQDSGAKKKGPSSNGATEPSTYFGHISAGIDKHGPSLLKSLYGGGSGPFSPRRNKEQEMVDSSHQDARHLSVLQNLMHTDDVLAEADPEQIVSIYNTLKENAPELAGDPNTARVILRSAIQHDGISPFDLKSFLDTEAAKQKVVMNQHSLADRAYAGKSLLKPKEDKH